MNGKRESGVLCHITSLPGRFGSGDLGGDAYSFVDFLAETDQRYWQILPLSPVGSSASPYQGLSAFAGNPLLISPELLCREGLLKPEELSFDVSGDIRADFEKVSHVRYSLLEKAAERFMNGGFSDGYRRFVKANKGWLKGYALFMAAGGYPACTGMTPARAEKKYPREAQKHMALQYFFFSQWAALKKYANGKGIGIIGDLPIFLDYGSESLWLRKDLFLLDDAGRPSVVSGVPPDYFCENGQYWGNPMYDWQKMREDGFRWWKDRIAVLFNTVDVVRIDHFRAFSRAWQIRPNKNRNAKRGRWENGPGKEFFDAVLPKNKKHVVIAEDLGIIDDRVRVLRDECGFPGMCILQFAFDGSDNLYLPHNHRKNSVVYTGTHDNNTTLGWWQEQDAETQDRVRRYLSIDGNAISRQLMACAAMSVAETAIYPMQDVLELDAKHRMNIPGTPSGNWGWRFSWDMLTDDKKEFLKSITGRYFRNTGQNK